MKRNAIIFALAAMTALITSCGQVNEDISSVPETAAPVQAESSDNAESIEEEEAQPEESQTEAESESEVQEESSVAEVEEAETDDSAQTVESEAEQQPEDEFVFDSVQGESYSFSELYSMGLGNTLTDGTSYVIVPDSGGAGHAYYNIYAKAPEDEWEQGGIYDELSGTNHHMQLEDGGLLLITSLGAANIGFPEAYHLMYNGDDIEVWPLEGFFDELKPYIPDTDSDIYVSSITDKGFKQNIVFSAADTEEVLLDIDFRIDLTKMKATRITEGV